MGHLSSYWLTSHPLNTKDGLLTRAQSPKTDMKFLGIETLMHTNSVLLVFGFSVLGEVLQQGSGGGDLSIESESGFEF